MSITERIEDAFTGSNHHVKNALSNFYDYELVQMNICRKPVEKILLQIIKLFNSSFKKFNERYSYDEIFHLYAIFEIKSPDGNETVFIRTEKNPRIVFQTSDSLDLDTEDHYDIKLNKLGKVKFGDMIVKCKSIMGDSYDKYNAVDNNCQVYILKLLEAFFKCINISNVPSVYVNYIYLDVSKALKKTSFAAKLAEKVTNAGRFFNALLGKGKSRNKSEYRKDLQNELSYELSDDDINDFFDGKINIVKYQDLKNKNIDDLLKPYNNCIILWELDGLNSGHWTILCNKGNKVCFFDSYGHTPENELKYKQPEAKYLDQPYGLLLKILYEQPDEVEYNNYRFQHVSDFINTCGKWCCVFGKLNYDVDGFRDMIYSKCKELRLHPDELICYIYDKLKNI